MEITWYWITNQVFAFLGLIFVVLSFQQKSTKKLLILRNIATLLVFIPNTKKITKNIASILIVILLIALNIIYWKNFYNLYSIVLGTLAVYTFMQDRASMIRKLSVVIEILSIIYYSLLLSPTNIVIEVVGLVSAIVGIIRLDRRKN